MTQANPATAPAGIVSAAEAAGERVAPAEPPRAAPHAAATRRLYAADWAGFATWCRERRLGVLPASPATVVAYLGSLAPTLSHGALTRRAAAIAGQHRWGGHASPTTDPAVQDVIRTARAAKRASAAATTISPDGALHVPARRKPPPGRAQLNRMAARCLGDLAGLRDRALLLLAAAGVDGERLLALDFEHVRLTGQGMELTIRSADGIGQESYGRNWVTTV